MKKWIVIQVAAVVLLAIAGQVWLHFPGRWLSSMYVQEDMLTEKIGVEYVLNEEYCDSLVNYPDQFDDLKRNSTVIIIAKPTGKIFQEGEFFGQEIVVTKTIKGAERIKADGLQDRFYVFDVDGFRVYDDGQTRYYGGHGLMQRSSMYLLFLEPVRYAALFPVKGYGPAGGFFGRIKLGDDARSVPVTVPAEDLLYDDVWDYEYIAESEAVLDQMYLMKARILKMMAGELEK